VLGLLRKYKDFWKERAKELVFEYSRTTDKFSVEKYRMQLVAEILKNRSLVSSLLDIGCGPGTFLSLCNFVENKLGIDFSEAMIASAKKQYPNITFEKVSIEEYITQDKYNAITALSVLPYIKDEKPVYNKIHGLLSDNGLFIASYPNSLFNMFTDNELTYDFMDKIFYNYLVSKELKNVELKNIDSGEKSIFKKESARGKIFLREENPLEIHLKLRSFGFNTVKIIYLNIHPLKPKNMKKFNIDNSHSLYKDAQVGLKEDWRSTFLASTFMIVATKIA